MTITAPVHHAVSSREASVSTARITQRLALPHGPSGPGSAGNEGELLMLPLATRYCNDLHSQTTRLGLGVDAAEVKAKAVFPGVGLSAWNLGCRACVTPPESKAQIVALEPDAMAELRNTLKAGAIVSFEHGS